MLKLTNAVKMKLCLTFITMTTGDVKKCVKQNYIIYQIEHFNILTKVTEICRIPLSHPTSLITISEKMRILSLHVKYCYATELVNYFFG